ncbi:peptidase S8/S53 domain-containing protein [Lactarius indigo]|nr:peptidase S8/S53 domain-containing protein [Lactarius indigo]
MSVDLVALTTKSPWRGSSGVREVGIGRARGGAAKSRLHRYRHPHARVPASAVHYGGLYIPAATDRNVLGVAGYLDDSPSPTDLAAFLGKYRTDAAKATFDVMRVDSGGYDPNQPHAESNLYTQYTVAMAYPTPLIFYSTGRGLKGTDDWYVSWLRYVLRQKKISQTISTSYGTDENLCSREYAVYVCRLFAILGARGVSVLFGTGDHGVGDEATRPKTVPSSLSPNSLQPVCRFVTAVGETTGFDPEVGADFSGGGFSNHFERQKYQQQVVSSFLEDLGSRYEGLYNASGCGIPNIAAYGTGFPLFFKGEEEVAAGTSGSTPVCWVGIISLLNDYRLSKRRPTLGFLNPWLYGRDLEYLTDITDGSNPSCKTGGFSAVTG